MYALGIKYVYNFTGRAAEAPECGEHLYETGQGPTLSRAHERGRARAAARSPIEDKVFENGTRTRVNR